MQVQHCHLHAATLWGCCYRQQIRGLTPSGVGGHPQFAQIQVYDHAGGRIGGISGHLGWRLVMEAGCPTAVLYAQPYTAPICVGQGNYEG